MLLHNLVHALQGNAALARRNRFARLVIAVQAGAQHWTVKLGVEPIVVETGLTAAPDIELKASADTWANFAKPVPPFGYQSFNGMKRVGHSAAI